jgi:hypothetical protein
VAMQSNLSMSISNRVSVYASLRVESRVYRVNIAKCMVKTVSIPSLVDVDVDESKNISINIEISINVDEAIVVVACRRYCKSGTILAWHRFN